MNLLDILKKKNDKNPILDLLGRVSDTIGQGVSNVGKFVGQQPIINNPTGVNFQMPTVNQTAQTLAPNSAISAFMQGNSQDIIPNIASTLRTQGQNAQTPEGMVGMVSGTLGSVAEIPEKLLAAARTARGVHDLTTTISKNPELNSMASKIINDTNHPINSVKQLFDEAKSRQQFSTNLRNSGTPDWASNNLLSPENVAANRIAEGIDFSKKLNENTAFENAINTDFLAGTKQPDFVKGGIQPNSQFPRLVRKRGK